VTKPKRGVGRDQVTRQNLSESRLVIETGQTWADGFREPSDNSVRSPSRLPAYATSIEPVPGIEPAALYGCVDWFRYPERTAAEKS